MKKLLFAAAFMLCILGLKKADAQISIGLSLNIDTQPDWGPTGYDHVDYYYLPDIDCYYYVPTKQFVYQSGSQWVWRSSLPSQYASYDLYNSYKVVVNKPKPYMHDAAYRTKYSSYKGRRGQSIIRNSHDDKYRKGSHSTYRPSAPAAHREPIKSASQAHRDDHDQAHRDDHNNDHHDKKDDHGHH